MLTATATEEVEVVTQLAGEAGSLVQDEQLISELLTCINNERSDAGLNTLTIDNTLTRCAEVRAMEASAYWSHTRPDGSSWSTVMKGVYRGENLGRGYDTGEAMFQAWMASSGHKANLLESRYKTCGIAIYETNRGLIWCIGFGL